jgi:hypothetical protein
MPDWYNASIMNSPENKVQPVAPVAETQIGLNPEFEQQLRALVTPERSRLIAFAATKQKETLSPAAITPQPDLESKIKTAGADDLPFKAGEMVSYDKRIAFWEKPEHRHKSFAEKNKEWNEGMHRTILELIALPQDNDQQKALKAELAKETLQHLDLTGAEAREEKEFTQVATGSQRVSLYSDIEAFRIMYFDRKSDINGFVRKIAEQCPGVDGGVDVVKLQKRLEAIKPLLISFGDQSVDSMVEDFAVSFGLLTQKGETKTVIAGEAINKLQSPVSTEEKSGLYELLKVKQSEIERPLVQAEQEQVAPQNEVAERADVISPEQSANEREVFQPEIQAQQPESRELTPKMERIEQGLSIRLGTEIKLSPKLKEIMPITPSGGEPGDYYGYIKSPPPMTENEFIAIYTDQYMRLKNKNVSHDEIIKELDEIFSDVSLTEDGKKIVVRCKEVDKIDGAHISVRKRYPRIP